MSSNLFAITISLKPSRKAIALFTGIYLVAILAVLLTEIPLDYLFLNILIKILIILLIAWNAFYVFTKYILLSHKKAITNIECNNLQWTLNDNDLKTPIELLQIKALSSHIIVLRFFENVSPSRINTLFVFSDNTTPENFHQLLLLSKIIF